jgi:regulator of cell morphogenesis and NO signaling
MNTRYALSRDTAGGMELGQLVREFADADRVFDRHGLDFCSAANTRLVVACQAAGVDPTDVWADLVEMAPRGPNDWADMDASEIVDHLEAVHHRPLREKLPVLEDLMAKVLADHGDRHRDLSVIAATLASLSRLIEAHLPLEERTIFPMARAQSSEAGAPALDGTLELVAKREAEHGHLRQLLVRIRDLTAGFRPPADADGQYAHLFVELESLERSLRLQMFKESQIVFPLLGDRQGDEGLRDHDTTPARQRGPSVSRWR